MAKIIVPYNYTPRSYQLPLLRALDSGIKRAISIWHRRAGKDKTLINLCAKKMLERVGSYYYFFPTYAQGKKVIWDGMDKTGFPFLGHFPKELLAGVPNSTEMKLRFKNGSIFQVVGSDNIDSIMGTNPVGCVYSEFALQDPSGADYMSPILMENGGWEVYNTTPRGKNHAFRLYQMAKENPDWFSEILTCEDTGVVTPEMIQAERDRGRSEEFIQQEYFCSFNAPMDGAVYGAEMRAAQFEGRITKVPHDPALQVETWWDIGVNNAIWFTQTGVSGVVRCIDYHHSIRTPLPEFAKLLREKNYSYKTHHGPWDIEQDMVGKSWRSLARDVGLEFHKCERILMETGLGAAQAFLPKCVFDAEKCAKGIDALQAYRYTWDPKKEDFSKVPYHDVYSHGADAYKLLAMNHEDAVIPEKEDRYSKRQRGTKSWMTA